MLGAPTALLSALSQRLPTLQALPGANSTNPGDVYAQMEKAQRDQQMAEALMNSGYVQNSGGLGALAQIFSAYQGGKIKKGADESLADAARKQYTLESQAKQAQKAEAQAAEQSRRDFELSRDKAKADAALANRAAPRPVTVGNQLVDPATGKVIFTGQQAPQQPSEFERLLAQLPPEQRQAAIMGKAGLGSNNAPSGYRMNASGQLEAIPGGPADPAVKAQGQGALTADQRAKVALVENALRDARAYVGATVGKDGSFGDIAANMPENSRLLDSAIRAKLRAESGASIQDAEMTGETNKYGQQLLSSDATNASAAQRLVTDLENQLQGLQGGNQAAQPAQATQPTQGPQPGMVEDGYRFKGGNPADPNAWEKI